MRIFRSFLLTTILSLALCQLAFSTHYRAGEVLYKRTANFEYEVTVVTYSKTASPSNLADRDSVEVEWGDGQRAFLMRQNGPDLDGNGVPDGEFIFADIKMNRYVGKHQYPGAPPPPRNFYILKFYDQNRIAGIANIDNGSSVEVPFFVEDTLKFPGAIENIGANSSPVLHNYPIDYANVNRIFNHNPGAIDPDGDSLDYQLIVPQQDHNVQVPLYLYPDQYCPTADVFSIDRKTGDIVWDVPCQTGIFNIAILITEYRQGVVMGTLIRDMQIIVLNERNDPPKIDEVRDTCIRAGDSLIILVKAKDPNPGQMVTLSARGGPFEVATSKASFPTVQGIDSVEGTFRWGTNCDHLQSQPYLVTFRAEDNYVIPGSGGGDPAPLVDIETWQIRVIAPPVENLTATVNSNSITLNWQNPYACASNANFRGFSVWRKTDCDPFTPDYCETNLAAHGYTQITTNNIFTYTYTDNTVVIGQQYSYRIVAHFWKLSPNGIFPFDPVSSVASQEVCVFAPVSVPVMLNVDILTTSNTNGQIFTRWAKPLTGGNNLDTLVTLPPYQFDLYRGDGFNWNNPVQVQTFTSNSYSEIIDTVFTDNTGLNTQDGPWSYRVLFRAGANRDTIGWSAIASSIYLTVNSSDQSLPLTWSENVPWTNDSFAIFRKSNITGLFDSIGVSYTHAYTDTGLQNDSTYCYYVKGYGHYGLAELRRPLINKSQEDCGVPIDTVAPCPPNLFVRNDCGQFENRPWSGNEFINYLSWFLQNDPCSDDITRYYIYFSSDSTDFTLIDSVTSKATTTYNHSRPENLEGCYAVTALDRIGNQSRFSNIICIDNCPYYLLPNTFTPNNDGKNDLFHPFKPYRFVPKIEMRIYNRWGEEVFRTEDPEINWDGRDQKTQKPLSDGVYLYSGYYYEQRLNGLVQRPLSGQKKGGGFIHLIRGK